MFIYNCNDDTFIMNWTNTSFFAMEKIKMIMKKWNGNIHILLWLPTTEVYYNIINEYVLYNGTNEFVLNYKDSFDLKYLVDKNNTFYQFDQYYNIFSYDNSRTKITDLRLSNSITYDLDNDDKITGCIL